MGKYIEQEVEKLKQKHPSIGDFRNTGLLGCIELVTNRKTKEPMAPFNAKPDEMIVMNKVAAKIKELGMYTFVRWGFIFIAPPLIVTKEQINEGLAIISEAINIADESLPNPSAGGASDSENLKLPYSAFEYQRRETFAVENIGAKQVPVVVADLSKIEKITPTHLQSIGYTYNEATDKWAIREA